MSKTRLKNYHASLAALLYFLPHLFGFCFFTTFSSIFSCCTSKSKKMVLGNFKARRARITEKKKRQ
jgi:hypothetical protein